ncbi:MAG: hypothetical protein ABW321_20330, partial [Polyangiales bacterium]
PQARTASVGTTPVADLVSSLLTGLTVNVSLLGLSVGLLNDLLAVVTSTLRSVTGPLGTVLGTLLSGVVDPLLDTLGVRLGRADVVVDKVYAVPVGASCDDNQHCTVNDTCGSANVCTGTPRDCSDGLSCTTDTCNEDTDMCVSSVTSGCLVNGVCQADGFVDPSNSCRGCVPTSNRTAYSALPAGATCSDGLFCTSADTCNGAGLCLGGPLRDCSDNVSCTLDLCNELADRCDSTVNVGCLIDGACVGDGAALPGNSCQICNPLVSLISYVARTPGTACNDGLFCTTNDQCVIGGLCLGSPLACNDNLACTLDSCNETSDRCDAALTLGCVIDGACVAPGTPQPGNPCRSCNPLVSTTAWSNNLAGSPCDDGQFCTVGDTCNAQAVCGGNARSCTDLIACTTDTCNEANDTCTSAFTGGCTILGSCYAANTPNPLNSCSICDPARSTTNWSTKAVGQSCEDGLYCTDGDTCNGLGLCQGGPLRSCDDATSCTTDVCNELTRQCESTVTTGCRVGGACITSGAQDPSNQCRSCNPLLSRTAYSNKLVGTTCDDGQFCTLTDVCGLDGTCAGLPRICEDGLLCTTDSCDEAADRCTSTTTGGCAIGGLCYPAGIDDPLNSCRSCDPATSTTSWTNKAAATECDDGQYCTVGETCGTGGACGGGTARVCPDDGLACTSESCNELLDLCAPNALTGCFIAGACVPDGAPDPLNPCHVCDVSVSQILWTNRPVGTSCSDNLFCTTGDQCNALGLCLGTVRDCSDGQDCTLDACSELTGECVSTTSGCIIDGVCQLLGTLDPTNNCRTCDPLVSIYQWSNRLLGTSCDDGQFCTVSDQCDATGQCAGTAQRSCNDLVACTTDTCDEAADTCTAGFAGGCTILGSCYAAGTPNPLNSCQVCDPSRSTSLWSNKPNGAVCEDGLYCTSGDQCTLGLCVPGGPRACDDGVGCTTDICNELTRRCESTVTLGCQINGLCVAAGTQDPSNQCKACNPLLSTSAYSNKLVGTTCDDGLFCTTLDGCSLTGTCTGVPRICEDGLLCTTDTCNENTDACTAQATNGCAIGGLCYPSGTEDPTNSCRSCNPAVSTTSWTNKATGATCNDGQYCTVGETCSAAASCGGGTPRVCPDDGLACTSESCNELLDVCTPSALTGCFIAGACVPDGAPDPLNPCHVCDVSVSTLLWTNRPVGTSCDDNLFCTSNDQCNVLGLCLGTGRDCSDGQDCTLDVCSELTGECESTPSGCIIDGVCQLLGTLDPRNSCRTCEPLLSLYQWTNRLLGTSCDDGQFCTVNDQCNDTGECVGTAQRSCNDLVSCTTDACDETNDSCTASFAGGCTILGSCFASGTPNPLNSCQICDPARSTILWSNKVDGATCDDGLFCTDGDTCRLGLCLPGGLRACDDGVGCTTDLCNELTRQCEATVTDGCQINGLCVAAGTQDPSNQCKACNPLLSTTAYSIKLPGTLCDDSQFCTATDVCDLNGVCTGIPRICEDGLLCTTDSCDETSDRCTSSANGGCTIGGLCFPAGFDDPTNSCRTCDPARSTTGWSTKPAATACDDGQFCTVGETCGASGACGGGAPLVCPDDGLGCTTEVCNELLDVCLPGAITGCLIGGNCLLGGVLDPLDSCHVCDPSVSTILWTNRPVGTMCDDGSQCTSGDSCNALGLCTGALVDCSDGLDCTLDVCNPLTGQCSSTTAGCTIDGQCVLLGTDDPQNSCRTCNPLLSTTSWSDKPQGALCNDGQFCTVVDSCDGAGSCSGGVARVCTDLVACTEDLCDEAADACTAGAAGGGCVIGGSCYPPGTPNPLNGCQVCDPARSTLLWSNQVDGTACEDGLFCTDGDRCTFGLCLGGGLKTCDDSAACTSDFCNELTRQCEATVTRGCQIDGQCVAPGTQDPTNQCRACNPLLSTTAYSNKVVGTGCDDQQFCTVVDVCGLDGSCAGLPRLCEDGLLCTADSCDETADACTARATTGCAIGNTCWLAGAVDPTNNCRTCNPAVSSTSWTTRPTGTTCNDGQFCTVNDTCSAAGSCVGSPRICNDGLVCTSETCNELLDVCVPTALTGCAIAGACVAAGAVDPLNACHVCDPAASTLLWSNRPVGTSCEDGFFCTTGDACNVLGLCTGAPRSCDDGLACTLDVCNELNDTCSSSTAGCTIDGACVLAGASDPTSSCRVCNPLVSTTTWSPRPSGALCDDGQFCTILDQCDAAGVCTGASRSCSDGLPCTEDICDETADECSGLFAGGCLIDGACFAEGDANPLAPCLACDPGESTIGWTPKPVGASCEDGIFCTEGETCSALGVCSGQARVCNDGLDCTSDFCNELTRQCEVSVTLGCQIDGACIAVGAVDPGNPCRGCDPLLSTTAYSDRLPGAACDDGAFCTTDDRCDASRACVGTPRVCDDGLGCTTDSCDEGVDQCVGQPTSGCAVDGACRQAGDSHPTNPCQVCDPTVSTTGWTDKPSGDTCDDGLFCTVSDACDGAGLCTGFARVCDDGLDCTSEVCNESLDVCTESALTGCLIAGVCYTAGAEDPTDSCRICDPLGLSNGWTARLPGTSCDDGSFCTVDDRCDLGGRCTGAGRDCTSPEFCQIGVCDEAGQTCGIAPRDCSDGLDCTADSCDEAAGQCVASLLSGCVIDGACHAAGGIDPTNPCHTCDPARSTSAWSDIPAGSACDDGLFCTVGETCDAAGSCVGAPRVCDDGSTCTTDACDEAADLCGWAVDSGCEIDGACRAAGSDDPQSTCRVCNAAVSVTTWTNKASGSSCDDGRFCSVADQCDGSGVCAGAARNCEDGSPCTSDSCNELSQSCNSLLALGCLIDGACVLSGAVDPSDPCRACLPSSSLIAYSPQPVGTGCDDGQYCTAGETCDAAGSCTGTPRVCDDGLECTLERCDEASDSCALVAGGDGCSIDGECVPAGTTDPDNFCHVCDPLLEPVGWSFREPGTACAEGAYCVSDAACTPQGECVGTPRDCSDGLNCTVDNCDEVADECTWTLQGACVIDGECIAVGAQGPGGPCSVCDPEREPYGWTGLEIGEPCDDGVFCTVGEVCDPSGECTDARVHDCSDALGCTVDLCNESASTCEHVVFRGCAIDGACLPEGAPHPSDGCLSCVAASSPTRWTRSPSDQCREVGPDEDSDGDGIPNAVECPLGAGMCRDTDGDGTPDYLDPDDDEDGLDTAWEIRDGEGTDHDDDGTPDYIDDDDDDD